MLTPQDKERLITAYKLRCSGYNDASIALSMGLREADIRQLCNLAVVMINSGQLRLPDNHQAGLV